MLVEGESDRSAVEALATHLGRDLAADDVRVVAMGGATNVAAYVARAGTPRILGLVDAAEAPYYRRVLDPADVFVCEEDLEDELIRALGVPAVLALVAEEGDLASYERFAHQPAQRDRPDSARLRRFLGTRSGRKIHYGGALVAAPPADRVPPPLAALMSRL